MIQANVVSGRTLTAWREPLLCRVLFTIIDVPGGQASARASSGEMELCGWKGRRETEGAGLTMSVSEGREILLISGSYYIT